MTLTTNIRPMFVQAFVQTVYALSLSKYRRCIHRLYQTYSHLPVNHHFTPPLQVCKHFLHRGLHHIFSQQFFSHAAQWAVCPLAVPRNHPEKQINNS